MLHNLSKRIITTVSLNVFKAAVAAFVFLSMFVLAGTASADTSYNAPASFTPAASLNSTQDILTVSIPSTLSGNQSAFQVLTCAAQEQIPGPYYTQPYLMAGGSATIGGLTFTISPDEITQVSAGDVGEVCSGDRGSIGRFSLSKQLSVASLANGTYTLSVRLCTQTNNQCTTGTTQVVINHPDPTLTGSCSVSPNPASPNQTVTWRANPSGGNGSYTYSWSGTSSLAGTSQTVTKSYSTTGTKDASVVITSGSQSITKNCSVSVSVALSVSCIASPTSPNVNESVSWVATPAGGSGPYTYSWTGTNNLSGTGATTTKTYTTGGAKSATVTVTSGGNSASGTCAVTVNDPGDQLDGVIAVTSNVPTTWMITGQEPQSQTTNGTSGSYSVTPGNYTLIPATLPGYNSPVVSPVASQIVSSQRTTAFTISYTATATGTPPTGGGSGSAVTCSPTPQNVAPGDLAHVGASGGNSTYSWSAPGGTPSSGNAANFSTLYSSTGAKTITVTSNGTMANCTVNVVSGTLATTGSVTVSSNVATTWSLTGPTPQTQSTPASGSTYSLQETGSYTLTVPTLSGFNAPMITPVSSQTLTAGKSISFAVTYTQTGATTPSGGTPPAGGTLTCSPYHQTLTPNQITTFITAGGTGVRAWSASGGNPNTGADAADFATRFAAAGFKTINITRGTQTAACYASVNVTGNDLPLGSHDSNDSGSCLVSGWTTDPDDRDIDLNIKIYSDGTLVKTGFANAYRADLVTSCPGGTCGFIESLTGLISAGVSHSIQVKAVDVQTGAEWGLSGSPQSITCPAAPVAPATFSLVRSNHIQAARNASGATSTPTTITVNPSGGGSTFTGTVALSASSGSPALSGAVYTFSDASLSSAEYAVGSTMLVRLPAGVPNGTYPIVVRGDSNGLVSTVTVNLSVSGKNPTFDEF